MIPPKAMAPEQTFVINHPYHPQDVGIPHYRPNKTPLIGLLGSFVLIIFILLYGSLNVAKLCNSRLGRRDLSTFLWFVLCGFLHCFFEGYYVINHQNIAMSQSLFSQLWKEYALSDSRYLTSDPFMLCIETFTAVVWGPLSWVIAWMICHYTYFRTAGQRHIGLSRAAKLL
ncbi:hypothetical protein P8C59_004874 [Phyllachora maydis]|uniref:EXPERA domain-containing protein n=1 Tax=Phyllachora maydis TaxID=1825666 RepID=A0AAD9I3I6_9PEZI|nr:hypothetical protein P8C59_004874 [Phyllachora maydis]